MGVSLFPLTPGIAQALDLKVERGAIIVEVFRNGPADQAGLRGSSQTLQVGNIRLPVGGDIIVALNGEPVRNSEELVRKIREYHPGDRAKIKILRNGHFQEIKIVLGERP